jgi:hypothetical protein
MSFCEGVAPNKACVPRSAPTEPAESPLLPYDIEFSCRTESNRHPPVRRTSFLLNGLHPSGQLQRFVRWMSEHGPLRESDSGVFQSLKGFAGTSKDVQEILSLDWLFMNP